jgi:hypothetical protein
VGGQGEVGQWLQGYKQIERVSASVLLHSRVNVVNNSEPYILK